VLSWITGLRLHESGLFYLRWGKVVEEPVPDYVKEVAIYQTEADMQLGIKSKPKRPEVGNIVHIEYKGRDIYYKVINQFDDFGRNKIVEYFPNT
jgi:hypothetical protein